MSFNACPLQVDLLQKEQLQDLFPKAFHSWPTEDLPTSSSLQVHPLKAGRPPCSADESCPQTPAEHLIAPPEVAGDLVRGRIAVPEEEMLPCGAEDASETFPDNLSMSSCFSPKKSMNRESEARSYFEEFPKKRSLTKAQEMLRRELKKQAKKLREHWAVKRVVAPSPFLKLTLKGFLAKKRKAELKRNGVVEEEEFSLI